MKITKIHEIKLAEFEREEGCSLLIVDDEACDQIRERLGPISMFFMTSSGVGNIDVRDVYIKMNHEYTPLSDLFKDDDEKENKKDFH